MRDVPPRRTVLAVSVAALGIVVAAFAIAWHAGLWRLPDRHNPWAPLSLAETPGWTTRFKLSRLSRDPTLCREVLEGSGWKLTWLPDRETGEGCGFSNAARIERMGLQVQAPFSLSCPAAASLALWERHVLWPAAMAHFGAAPVRLEHFGSYACRNVYGRRTGSRSRHATADAIDVSGIVLEGGRRIAVARSWDAEDPSSEFVQELHRGACRFFDGVLGPDYNAAHADHLHLDRGPFRVCR